MILVLASKKRTVQSNSVQKLIENNFYSMGLGLANYDANKEATPLSALNVAVAGNVRT